MIHFHVTYVTLCVYDTFSCYIYMTLGVYDTFSCYIYMTLGVYDTFFMLHIYDIGRLIHFHVTYI